MATEGINGTIGGTKVATKSYIKAMRSHPVFKIMDQEDLKVKNTPHIILPDELINTSQRLVL